MPNDYSGTKQVRILNGQKFIDDFMRLGTVGVMLPAGRFLRISKTELWQEARNRKLAYILTDSVYQNGRVCLAVFDSLAQDFAFQKWKHELKVVAAKLLSLDEHTIELNDQQSREWYDSGFTPEQCFRENWHSDGD